MRWCARSDSRPTRSGSPGSWANGSAHAGWSDRWPRRGCSRAPGSRCPALPASTCGAVRFAGGETGQASPPASAGRRASSGEARASGYPEWCQAKCRDRLKDLFRALTATWRGYDPYEGVHGTSASLQEVCTGVRRILCQGLNRRRQRRRYTGTGFRALVHHFRVVHPHRVGRPPPRWAAGRA
jgi:hypothetical protein